MGFPRLFWPAYGRRMSCNAQVVTVGHAIVDVLAPVGEDLVAGFGLDKGTMTLVDDARSQVIHAALSATTVIAGGSAANTAVGVASFGVGAAFVGKVRDDEMGRSFADGLATAGVGYEVALATAGPGTGRSLILVTPDAERTMCTSLGIGAFLGPDDVDGQTVANADVVYLEGYLCGLNQTDATIEATLAAARRGGTTVALSLSDPFWAELHGAELAALIERVDLLFGNAQEAMIVTGARDVRSAVTELAKRCPTVVVTRGSEGATVAWEGTTIEVAAEPVSALVDTTGAGDLFAAGFLAGWVRGVGPERSARLGALAAAEVIGHFGARPESSLAQLAVTNGLS
jgi:sugar/nucleoside kinase (ribokinase family)